MHIWLKTSEHHTADPRVMKERISENHLWVTDDEVTWSEVKLLVSVQILSAQYLLTPLLENRQTQFSGCLLRVDVPYWRVDHMVKGQSQTVGLNLKCCLLNILWINLWIKVKLSTANQRNGASQESVVNLPSNQADKTLNSI